MELSYIFSKKKEDNTHRITRKIIFTIGKLQIITYHIQYSILFSISYSE